MTIKAEAATVNDELVSLKQQVSDLVAVAKAKVREYPKGTTQQNGQKMEIKQTEEPKYLGKLINSLILPEHPKIINQHGMLSLLGMGPHGKECATPLNYLKGISMSLPPKSKRSKGARSSTDPLTLKAIRKQYHYPDPIAHFVGKVNEAHILIDDVEC